MKKIYLKLFIAMLPVLILTAVYFINDPFKVVYHYDSYFPADGVQYVNFNNDYSTTETFINHNKEYKYDSYIFGNSRGLVFHTNQWAKHIPSTNIFQFSVSNESLYGITQKMKLIDSTGLVIKNALFVIDNELYKTTDESKSISKHPLLSGKSMMKFKLNVFKGFFDPTFTMPYLKLLLTRHVDTTLFSSALNTQRSQYDLKTNDVFYPDLDPRIEADTAAYYKKRKEIFFRKDYIFKYTDAIINAPHIALMKQIKTILEKNNTHYKIVISPLYNQLKINTKDINIIYSIFGKENVYDYSGVNDITKNEHNYYENAHYRPFIANRIMDTIYSK